MTNLKTSFRYKKKENIQASLSNHSKYRTSIQATEFHLSESERHALDLSRRVGLLNEELKDAEIRAAECSALVRKAEQRIELISQEQSKTKRKLSLLYSSLISCSTSSQSNNNNNNNNNPNRNQINKSEIIPLDLYWKIFVTNSLLITSTQISLESHTRIFVDKLLESLKSNQRNDVTDRVNDRVVKTIDPFTPFCQFSLAGICNDTTCPFQHFVNENTQMKRNSKSIDTASQKKQYRKFLQLANSKGNKTVHEEDKIDSGNSTSSRYFNMSFNNTNNWRDSFHNLLSSSSSSLSSSSSYHNHNGSGSGSGSGDPIALLCRILFRNKVQLQLHHHDDEFKWHRKAIELLSTALNETENREDEELWLIYLNILLVLPETDRPDNVEDIFQQYLFDVFPHSWEIVLVLRNIIRDSSNSNSSSSSNNHSNNPLQLQIWINNVISMQLKDRESISMSMSMSTSTTSSSSSFLSHSHTSLPTVCAHTHLCPVALPLAMMFHMEEMCVQGRATDVIDMLCVLLGEESLLNSTPGVGSGSGVLSLSMSLPPGWETFRVRNENGSLLSRTVLWACLTLLFLTGEFQGVRLLCLTTSTSTSLFIPSTPFPVDCEGTGSTGTGSTGTILSSSRIKALLGRSVSLSTSFHRLCLRALQEVTSTLNLTEEEEEDEEEGDHDEEIDPAIQALCWSVVYFVECLDSDGTAAVALVGDGVDDLIQSAMKICPPRLFPSLYTGRTMAVTVTARLHRTLSIHDPISLMILRISSYLQNTTLIQPSSSTTPSSSSSPSEMLFNDIMREYISSNQILINDIEISVIISNEDKMNEYFWNIDKEIHHHYHRQHSHSAGGVSIPFILWMYIGDKLDLFLTAPIEKLSTLAYKIVALRNVSDMLPLDMIFMFIFGMISFRLKSISIATVNRVNNMNSYSLKTTTKELLELTIGCIDLSLHTPTTTSTSISTTTQTNSPHYYLNSSDDLGVTIQHKFLLEVLQLLEHLKLLTWEGADFILNQSLLLLPSPETIIVFFLSYFKSLPLGDSLLCEALDSRYSSSSSSFSSSSFYRRLSPHTCWRIFQIMWKQERFQTVKIIREEVTYVRHPQKLFYVSCMDQLSGMTKSSSSSFYPTSSLTPSSMPFEDPLTTERINGNNVHYTSLYEHMDLSILNDLTLRKLSDVCISPRTTGESSSTSNSTSSTTSTIDLSSSFTNEDNVPICLSQAASMLTDLNMEHNSFHTIPSPLLTLNLLQRLNLSWNLIEYLPTDLDSYLPHIKIINLAHNKISNFPMTIIRMQTLIELHLSNNLLEYLPNQIISLQELRVLDVSNNTLKVVPSGLAQKMKLQFLKISGNPAASFRS